MKIINVGNRQYVGSSFEFVGSSFEFVGSSFEFVGSSFEFVGSSFETRTNIKVINFQRRILK